MKPNENKLEHLHIRPLSDEERSRAWVGISTKLSTAPVLSPFVFPWKTVVSFATAFVLIVGTVGFSDTARPGDLLFSIDTATEQVESSIVSSSRTDHARERLVEFQSLTAELAPLLATETGGAERMAAKLAPAPEADSMMAFSSLSAEATIEDTAPELPPQLQTTIDTTRTMLINLLLEAINEGDDATASDIQAIIEEFEIYVENF